MPSSAIHIEAVSPAATEQLNAFFAYLREHVAENGAPDKGYFQPMSRETSNVSLEREERVRSALRVDTAQSGWRKLWLARTSQGTIAGHIDLRGHSEPHTAHRCLLGIGVHGSYRRMGLGVSLLQSAKNWAQDVANLEWIDLQVLSANQAAIRLYHRFGFVTVGEIPDMFRFDGQSFGYSTMALRLRGAKR